MISSPPHDSDRRPEENRFIPPNPTGSTLTGAPPRVFPTVTLLLFLSGFIGSVVDFEPSVLSVLDLDGFLLLRLDRNIDSNREQNPDLRFSPLLLRDLSSEFFSHFFDFSDDRRLRDLRFDLTLHIQDTFGDDGSVTEADFNVDSDLFAGKSLMFAGLQVRRFESMKLVF